MNHIFHTSQESSLPDTYWIALSTTDPLEDGTNFTEPSTSTGYTRVAFSGITYSTNGVVQNGSALFFPESTGDQGIVTHWGFFDSPTVGEGNLILFGELEHHRVVGIETILSFKPEYLKLELIG